MIYDAIKKLKDFKEGDVVTRTDLLEELTPYLEQVVEKKNTYSNFFSRINNYINHLPYTKPIYKYFYNLGLFLEKLLDEDRTDSSKKIIKGLAKKLNLMMKKENSSKVKSDFEYTDEDEANIDYSQIVLEQNMLNTYLSEASEFLDSAQSSLLDLEHDSTNEDAINKVFRCFHTLKSSSALLGFKNIEVFSHYMETMLGKIRDKEIIVSSELIDVIFHGIGVIRDLIQVIENNNSIESIVLGFKKFKLTPYIHLLEKINSEYKTQKIGQILKEMGAISDINIDSILKTQNDENKVFGEVALEKKIVTEEELHQAVSKQVKQKSSSSYVKVSSVRLNQLIDMVGELVVNQSMIRQKIVEDNNTLKEHDVNQLEEVTTSIKDMVLAMGMVPLKEMLEKLRVVIRNTSRELNKVISFEVSGEDTEMDRSLIESIYDPLVHMVRNSVSHGIEDADVRKLSNKESVGTIKITAEYRGNGVEISVMDDGKGLDPERIVDKAIEMGLIENENRNEYLENKDLVYQLIFRPGFSTKDKADSISGRGVGMDVVLQNIQKINGKIEIHSEIGKGSTFKIKLPLTLAIIDGFVTEIMDEFYVFPFELVEEILVSNEIELVPMEDNSSMGLSRGKYFPIVDFHKMLTGENGIYEEKFLYVLINYEDTEMAIPVNKVLGKQEIVIKNLNELIRHQKLFYGGTIFGDGSIGFILDIDEIISAYNLPTEKVKQLNIENSNMEELYEEA